MHHALRNNYVDLITHCAVEEQLGLYSVHHTYCVRVMDRNTVVLKYFLDRWGGVGRKQEKKGDPALLTECNVFPAQVLGTCKDSALSASS